MNSPGRYSERFVKEAQPNDRLKIVRALHGCSRGSHLIGSVLRLTALRDKLNGTLAEVMQAALSAPNENIPISRLPSEVFLRICELAYPRKTRRSVFDVIALTHVCRRWRDSLLSHPIIWSRIYLRRDSPESLITTLLKRSRGVPLTVNIQFYSDYATQVTCGCKLEPTWEDGDCCPHPSQSQHMPSLDLLEPFRANIHTLSVRYLRNASFADTMDDLLTTPFFTKPLPNLESLRWSCRHFGRTFPPFRLSQEPFGSSLPCLRRLSVVNCWGLLLIDTPVLEVMSMESSGKADYTGVSADQVIHSLRRRQSLVSLSLINIRIIPDANNPPSPVSMKNLKEITLRNVRNGIVPRYTLCPSIGVVTTLRIASLNEQLWEDGWSVTVSVTATDGSGGSVSTSARLADDLALRTAWEELASAFAHRVTALEVEDLHLIAIINSAAIPNLTYALPNLHTVRVQLQAVAESCEALRSSLQGRRCIARVERLVGEMESPDEARRISKQWKARHIESQIHDLLV